MAAYIVFTRLHTRDTDALARYAKQAPSFLAGHTIKWLAPFGSPLEVVEGAAAEAIGILEFRSLAEAKAWYSSPAYQEASKHRYVGADYSAIIVDGAAVSAT
jgi:uncharacterized protein (DUF1330 family)